MQDTRLSSLVSNSSQRFGRWLRNPWRRLSLITIFLLLGNFLATAISTVAGQRAELDILVAAFLAALIELINWIVYSGRLERFTRTANGDRLWTLEALNGVKIGAIYGLFVEAFKLGS